MNTLEQQIKTQALMDAALKLIANPPDNILGLNIAAIKAKHTLGRKLASDEPHENARWVLEALVYRRMDAFIRATMDLTNLMQIYEEQCMEFPDLVTLLSGETR